MHLIYNICHTFLSYNGSQVPAGVRSAQELPPHPPPPGRRRWRRRRRRRRFSRPGRPGRAILQPGEPPPATTPFPTPSVYPPSCKSVNMSKSARKSHKARIRCVHGTIWCTNRSCARPRRRSCYRRTHRAGTGADRRFSWHARARAHTRTHTHTEDFHGTHTHARTHAHTHALACARTRTCTHTHTHTHTHRDWS